MLKWLATFLIVWFLYEVREVFPPFIVGGIIAYLLLPIVKWLAELRIGRFKLSIGIATAVIYLLVGATIVVLVWCLVPGIIKELVELAKHQQDILEGALNQARDMKIWSGDSTAAAARIQSSLGESVGKPTDMANFGSAVSHGALFLLVCVVSSIYMTMDSSSLGPFFLRYLPAERRQESIVLSAQMNKLLTKYVHGQLILILLMSSATFVFLHLVLHMKYSLPVALLSGILEVVPVIGPILAITSALLVAIWQVSTSGLQGLGGIPAPVTVIIFYTLARWIEDYVVVPKIIGHAVELHPLLVIFAVMCGEELGGGLGMLIAIPVAACIKLLVDVCYIEKKTEVAR